MREQLILLDTVEARGYGNWEDIAKSINADLGANNSSHPLYKSPQAAKDHFGAVFLHGSMGRLLWREDQRGRALDHTGGANPALSPVKTEGQGGLGGGNAHLTSHESILLGYLPIRDDFEVEYDNEAESLVSHLIHLPNSSQSGNQQASRGSTEGPGGGDGLSPEGDNLENELKVAQVEMYKSRLRLLRALYQKLGLGSDYDIFLDVFPELSQTPVGETWSLSEKPYSLFKNGIFFIHTVFPEFH